LFGMSDEGFIRNQREMFYDRKFEASLEMEAEFAAQEMQQTAMGAPPDALGAPESPEEGAPLEEPPPEEGGAPLGPEGSPPGPEGSPEGEGGEGDESALLAAPGKRDDTIQKTDALGRVHTITPASKGKWYKPAAYDKRYQGARRKHYMRKATPEMGTSRTQNPGYLDMKSLSRGIYEEKETNYNQESEEKLLFEVHKEVEDLIKELETKENKGET